MVASCLVTFFSILIPLLSPFAEGQTVTNPQMALAFLPKIAAVAVEMAAAASTAKRRPTRASSFMGGGAWSSTRSSKI